MDGVEAPAVGVSSAAQRRHAEVSQRRLPVLCHEDVVGSDVEVEEACRYLEERGIPAYPYAAERPIAALAAAYQWARRSGKLPREA